MGLLNSEAGKRRLLFVEFPVVERYNQKRNPEYKIQVLKRGVDLVLRYKLKPLDKVYQLETILHSNYPVEEPETYVKTPLEQRIEREGQKLYCPHQYGKSEQKICLWKKSDSQITSQWNPSTFTCVFAIQAAWRWLAAYEIWLDRGIWPVPEAE